MNKYILTLFTCITVLFAQAQTKTPALGSVQQADKAFSAYQDVEELAIYPNPSNGVFTISIGRVTHYKRYR
jgi:hypothetical protein